MKRRRRIDDSDLRWTMCAPAGRPTRWLCEARRTAARRQNDKGGRLYLRRDSKWARKVVNADGRDGNRRGAGTFEFADEGGADRASLIGIEADMQVRCCDRHHDRKGDHSDRRYDCAVGRKSGCGRAEIHYQYLRILSDRCERVCIRIRNRNVNQGEAQQTRGLRLELIALRRLSGQTGGACRRLGAARAQH
jgi:hypothetical protein